MYYKCSNCGNDGHLKLLDNSNPPKDVLCFQCWKDQPVTIYVNSKPIQTIKKEISYIDIIGMAYPNITVSSDIAIISITYFYREGNYNVAGALIQGQMVNIKEDMQFTACFIGNA